MIIQNYEELATSEKKIDALKILEAGLKSADPENIIPKFYKMAGPLLQKTNLYQHNLSILLELMMMDTCYLQKLNKI